jgi:DNA-binding NtrC family response regulator
MTPRVRAYTVPVAMRGSVLVVDNDQDVCSLVADILRDEGYTVWELVRPPPIVICEQVRRLEPDVVLLDSRELATYGQSWNVAAVLHEHHRQVAVIMFTAHAAAVAEARLGVTERSRNAGFAGIVAKPFDLQVLVNSVANAVPQPMAVNRRLSA